MVISETKNNCINKNMSRLSTGSVSDLKKQDTREVFGNMMVDIKEIAIQKQRESVRQFLKQEFGDKRNFSESFIDKVLERLNTN